MVETYSWHPGIDRVASRWAIPVPLLPDEIFSSWLVRAALTQGCDPLVLTGEVWPKWRVWTLDGDRTMPEERLKPLSRQSGISPETFRAAMLHTTACRIHDGWPPEKAIWPWILTLGTRNTKRRSGLQYCPMCLSEDKKPYYRLHWRFVWHTCCEKHGIFLLDRCQACGAPVEPHRLFAEDQHVALCATCKTDLREARPGSSFMEAMGFQNMADRVVLQGHGLFQGQFIEVSEWFRLADFFISLIRRANRSGTVALYDFLHRLDVPLFVGMPVEVGAGIELLRTQERQKLFGSVSRLMVAGREQFEVALNESCITLQGFCGQGETLPEMLAPIVESLLSQPVIRTRKLWREKDGPRPRHEVMRMMAKLQRKHEMVRR